MTKPLASILIPTIGRDAFIEQTIESVQAQTLPDLEVIVLDNASPTSSARRLMEWADADKRVRVLRSDTFLPMFANFNRGIAVANGEYVTFFHDDNVYAPGFLEAMVSGLETHPSAGLAGSNYEFIDERGRVIERRRWIRSTGLVDGRSYIQSLIRRGRSIITMNDLVFRRPVLQGAFDDSLSIHFGDFVLLMRIAESWNLFLSADSLMKVRRHLGQASQSIPLSRGIPQRTRVLNDYCVEYLARHPNEKSSVTKLQRRIALLHRVGMIWGWAFASDLSEATACMNQLGESTIDSGLKTVMRTIDNTPLRTVLRSPAWLSIARKVGTILGV